MENTGQIIQEATEQVEQEVNSFMQFIQEHLEDIIRFGWRILIAILILIIGRILIRWIQKSVRRSFERANADKGLMQFTDSVLKFILYFLLIMAVSANLGIDFSSITVLFASAGVGISLAMQGTLSNFAGGVLILMLKPFKVGDYIIEDTHKNEGTVAEIKMFYTTLQTVDNRTIILPNGALSTNSLTNVTRNEERQLDLRVGISYESDLKKAKEITEKLILKENGVLADRPHRVFVDSLGDSSVVLGVRCWVKSEVYWDVRWSILENVKLTFDKEGIEIPYNQLKIHMDGAEQQRD